MTIDQSMAATAAAAAAAAITASPRMVHAATQTIGAGLQLNPKESNSGGSDTNSSSSGTLGSNNEGHGLTQGSGNSSSYLGKTRSQLKSAIHGGVTNRENSLRDLSRKGHQAGVQSSSQSHAPAPHHINPRRAAKIRHRSSTSNATAPNSATVTTAAAALLGTLPTPTLGVAPASAPAPLLVSGSSSGSSPGIAAAFPSSRSMTPNAHPTADTNGGPAFHPGRHTPGTITPLEMDPPVLSFWGTDPVPLPSRFARIKRKLVAGHEKELQESFARLITALQAEVNHIEKMGAHLIPSIPFADVDDPSQTTRFANDLKRYGVGVVRGVVPVEQADSYVQETVEYIEKKKDVKLPPPQDPTCFDFFWTPAQVRTRAHPRVLHAQRFMMGLWETNTDDKVATRFPITYADRIRIHGLPGFHSPPLANKSDVELEADIKRLPHPAKSADDWLNAIQSSTIIAQVDNGSLERWEPDGYQRFGTYDSVFKGEWDAYDPWECAGRVSTTTDLYNGYGACSIFRMFQGLLALSTIEPGMVRLMPSPKLAIAYFLLRPFFSPKMPCPTSREGPEWEAYLHPSNWIIDKEQSTIIHGAVPGHAQRVTELWHPHLHLRRSLVTLPTLQAGDYIFWHPDLPYHITSDGTGLRSENGNFAPDDVRQLVYIPAAPLTQTNALYLARQRKQFLRGQPPPDFDSTGTGLGTEAPPEGRLGKEHIAESGGPAAMQSMGLAPYETSSTPRSADLDSMKQLAGKCEDVEMAEAENETKSVRSTSSSSHGEAEVVRLANIILFPDQCNMGFPHKEPSSNNGNSWKKHGTREASTST